MLTVSGFELASFMLQNIVIPTVFTVKSCRVSIDVQAGATSRAVELDEVEYKQGIPQ